MSIDKEFREELREELLRLYGDTRPAMRNWIYYRKVILWDMTIRFSRALKWLLNIIVGGAALILLSPIFLITAIAIKIEDPGPVLYVQTRVGKYGEEFEFYKFRSMVMHADQINEPMLMIHGQMDNNSGTYPMQSERMFAAVKGNAGTARLVMLPYESHGYRGRESILHVLAESIDWLDRWVKPVENPMGGGEEEEAAE